MAKEKKGTVKLLSSEYPPAEVQKAAERVRDAISERRAVLDQIKDFASDNANLINLVQTLPNELQHEIMVPFGKAAFFPGRLIHTNELTVLLGEGYYAERTSKQTVEILTRRGKALESQIESVKAEIQDLKAEASLFEATADEAAAGVVQILEDYVEEPSSLDASEAGKSKSESPRSVKTENTRTALQDEEYKRILARFAELEKEEEEAEMANNDSEDDVNEDDLVRKIQFPLNQEISRTQVEHSNVQPVLEEGSSRGLRSSSTEKPLDHPVTKRNIDAPVTVDKKVLDHPGTKRNVDAPVSVEKKVLVPTSEQSSRSSKAFTGSIVERTHNLEVNPISTNPKPVPRFKMRPRQ